jgi:O-antigen/teichoic acid export membrane protein
MRRAQGLRAAALQTGAQILVTLAGYLTAVVVAKSLGPAQFGAYSIVYGTLLAVEVVGRLGLPQALTRQIAAAHQPEGAIIASGGMLLGACGYLVLLVLFWLAAPLLGAAFGLADGARLFRIAALDIPFYGLVFILVATLNGAQRHATATLVITIYATAKAIGILALALYGVSIAGALLVNVAASATGLLVAALAVRRMLAQPTRATLGATVTAAVPLSVRGVASQLLAIVGLWVLGATAAVPPEDVGRYAAALAIGRLPMILALGSTGIVVASVAAALARQDREAARRVVSDSGRTMLFLLVPPAAVAWVEGAPLMALMFGADYAAAGPLLAVLFAGQGVGMTMLLVLTAGLVGASRIALAMRINLLALVVALLSLPLILPFGAMGAALATAAGCLAGSSVAGLMLCREVGSWLSLGEMARLAAVTAAVAAAAMLLPSGGGWLLPEIAALAALQLALLVLAGLAVPREIRAIFQRRAASAS